MYACMCTACYVGHSPSPAPTNTTIESFSTFLGKNTSSSCEHTKVCIVNTFCQSAIILILVRIGACMS